VPFLHFFDGFRTSHEISSIEALTEDQLRAMLAESDQAIQAFRQNGLSPDRPSIRGTAQNPDVFFQAREAANRFYDRAPAVVQEQMDRFAVLTARQYHLFDYVGHPQAERVIVVMGSAGETAEQTARWLNDRGQRVGVVKVRLYRPFSIKDFVQSLPSTVQGIAVLDRTKEPGSVGEPLYLDAVCALREACEGGLCSFDREPLVIGGRYGLSSKEFSPGMAQAVFDELKKSVAQKHFTIGIIDDVTHRSLRFDPDLDIESKDTTRAVFFGLGADGTVGANKNTIKIIGEETSLYAQGYFVYDSKKSGAMTISHLRFGPHPIQAPYLIRKADFVACHQWPFVDRYEVLEYAAFGASVLLNCSLGAQEVWEHLSIETQEEILKNHLRLYVIDADKVARENGLGGRINTIMQSCFFGISNVLPGNQAIEEIKKAIHKTYAKKGDKIVAQNCAAVDLSLANLHEVKVPRQVSSKGHRPPIVPLEAPDFVQRITALMLANKGDLLPVSAFPPDGTWPSGTSRWEKRAIALEIPEWDAHLCIQCNKCVLVCPHAAIRAKFYPAGRLMDSPETFKSADFRSQDWPDSKYTLQVAPEDCTGCHVCVAVCPVKSKTDPARKAINMVPMAPVRGQEVENFRFFLDLPLPDPVQLPVDVKGSQFREPLFEFSGACSGCGETPYVKLLTQLFGDRLIIANATGCSSIYGGNLPTTPFTMDCHRRGPAWSNSLFEDNAEYGFGHRLGIDQQAEYARQLLQQLSGAIGDELVQSLLTAKQTSEGEIAVQRANVTELRRRLQRVQSKEASSLLLLADLLVKKSVWIVGGDGWAYDIGFGGLDHVIAANSDVNILVLDTEVYSNTGGQQSKSTPLGATAKFAVHGKHALKKDLGLLAMSYATAYVAQVAVGAKDSQTVKAFEEADSYSGASLVIAYSPCNEHGYTLDFGAGPEHQKLAVETGYWPIYRFDPRRAQLGEALLKLDCSPPKVPLEKFWAAEGRFRAILSGDAEERNETLAAAQADVLKKFSRFARLSQNNGAAAAQNKAGAPKD
jgi:pyruvate-ferredoxin/flavodoxin oxidoreductase